MTVAIALYALLPGDLLVAPRVVVPVLEVLLFVPLLAANPRRMARETTWLRGMSLGLLLLIAMANSSALVLLVDRLLSGGAHQGPQLLRAAGQVWATNVVVFALAYWELDRGGPVRRGTLPRERLPAADFRFPQDEDDDAVTEVAARASGHCDWRAGFVDYLYVSVTNSSAFSPTDSMPLSHRAKLLMGTQSVSALVLSVLVIARGVSLLQ